MSQSADHTLCGVTAGNVATVVRIAKTRLYPFFKDPRSMIALREFAAEINADLTPQT